MPSAPCHEALRPSTGTTSALLSEDAGRGAVVRREAARGIVADNLLTAGTNSYSSRRTPVRGRRAMADRCFFCECTAGAADGLTQFHAR
jgi:hypothetical protein